eukprot:356500-Chlamydomonas_euryale.AAC.17
MILGEARGESPCILRPDAHALRDALRPQLCTPIIPAPYSPCHGSSSTTTVNVPPSSSVAVHKERHPHARHTRVRAARRCAHPLPYV